MYRLLFLLLLTPILAQAQFNRPPNKMSVEDIQSERYGIRRLQQHVGYMKQVGGTIRDGACSSYWKAAKRALDEMNKVPEYYADKRAAFAQQNRSHLKRYRQCFSGQLSKYPKIYNHDMDPARSYEQFIQAYDRLTAEYNNGMQARFYDLGQELKRRGLG